MFLEILLFLSPLLAFLGEAPLLLAEAAGEPAISTGTRVPPGTTPSLCVTSLTPAAREDLPPRG